MEDAADYFVDKLLAAHAQRRLDRWIDAEVEARTRLLMAPATNLAGPAGHVRPGFLIH